MGLTRILPHLARPTTLVCASFLALAAGITANALLLQAGRHPTPLFVTRQIIEEPTPPESDGLVVAIQSALREAHYYVGPIDGIVGRQTRAAIEAYQAANGRAVSGEVSTDLLAALRESAAPKPEEGDAAPLPEPIVEPDIRVQAVQSALARAAYGPLPADGIFGQQTHEAIMRFQQDHGLPMTGELSESLVVELRAVGALEGE